MICLVIHLELEVVAHVGGEDHVDHQLAELLLLRGGHAGEQVAVVTPAHATITSTALIFRGLVGIRH
jgi:hypothetical protein